MPGVIVLQFRQILTVIRHRATIPNDRSPVEREGVPEARSGKAVPDAYRGTVDHHMKKAVQTRRAQASEFAAAPGPLLADVRKLIPSAREQVARAVNAALVLLYWQVGDRIRRDILKGQRAEYGERIVSALSAQLEAEFGRGFGRRNLFRMIRFAEVFPDRQIVSALM